MRVTKMLLLAATMFSSAIAHAEEASDPIIVTAGRAEQKLSEVGLSVSVIDAADLARRQTVTLIDVLRTVPGVTVANYGGLGSVFIRGASSEHTLTLIDGVKINDPSSTAGGFDFGRLTTNNIERIEVVRGSQSVLWGSQAIGGVINLISAQPTEDLKLKANAEYGYRESANLVANVSGKSGPVSASLGGGFFRTDGYSTFSERRGGKERDGSRQFGVNGRVNWALSEDISVDLRGWYADSRLEYDGGFPFGDNGEYSKTREFIGYAGLNFALFDGALRNRIAFSDTEIERDRFDAARQIGENTGKTRRFEYQGIYRLSELLTATFGAEAEKGKFTGRSDFSNDRGNDRLTSFYGQLRVTPLKGLTATGGVRHDDHSTFGGETSVSGNIAYTPNNGSTIVRASYGEGFKVPSLYQLYSAEYRNPALKPEQASSWDVSIVQRLIGDKVSVGLTWFERRSRNLIDFQNCLGAGNPSPLCAFAFDGYYDNIARAKAHGAEASLTLKPVDALTVAFNYSYTKSINAVTGTDLSRRPRESINASVDYQWPIGLKTGATVVEVGSSDNSPFDSVILSSYVLVDLRAAFPITDQIELTGRITNLFDEAYEVVNKYGTQGRAGFVGVRLTY